MEFSDELLFSNYSNQEMIDPISESCFDLNHPYIEFSNRTDYYEDFLISSNSSPCNNFVGNKSLFKVKKDFLQQKREQDFKEKITKDMSKEEIKMERNRISAKRSRERQKIKIEEMENIISSLTLEKNQLVNDLSLIKAREDKIKLLCSNLCNDCKKNVPIEIKNELSHNDISAFMISSNSIKPIGKIVSLIAVIVILCIFSSGSLKNNKINTPSLSISSGRRVLKELSPSFNYTQRSLPIAASENKNYSIELLNDNETKNEKQGMVAIPKVNKIKVKLIEDNKYYDLDEEHIIITFDYLYKR